MDIKKFPNPQLNLPKELLSEDRDKQTFDGINNYLRLVGKYIYTDIKLDHEPSDPNHIHAWVQKLMSANVIRSLYIRNAFVDAFNAGNTVGIFLPLKAWFETVGALASILDLLESNLPPDELLKRMTPHAIGNRGKGNFRVGNYDAMNVATMMEKANKYMMKIRERSTKHKGQKMTDSFFTDYYDMVSNPSHPSFDAYEVVGDVKSDGRWFVKDPEEVKRGIVDSRPGYGGALMAPFFVQSICEKILEIESKHFETLDSKKYFDK